MPDSFHIDKVIGARIRATRRSRGVTQRCIANALGVSVQQLQKYETGQNRVTPAVLVVLVSVLETPVSDFFDGLCERPSSTAVPSAAALRAAHDFDRLSSAEVRRSLGALIATLAESDQSLPDDRTPQVREMPTTSIRPRGVAAESRRPLLKSR